jgi:lysophospholipase L1-like esterase
MRPWLPGEPVPLLHLVLPEPGTEVRLDAHGEIARVEVEAATPEPVVITAEPTPEPPEARLPKRPPAVATALEAPEGALDHFFSTLAAAEDGEPGRVVRALHWGDSTIAADGITSTVRQRLQTRFGDGGPGFLAVHADPRWQIRPGVLRMQDGDWNSLTITFGGAETPRYGLGGNVSTAAPEGEITATLGGRRIEGKRQPLHRFDVHYQQQPEGGTVSVVPRGHRGAVLKTASEKVRDRFRELPASKGATTLWIKTHGDGPVTLYGVALETEGPGVTWETLGIAGSSIGSMTAHQARYHMKSQVERRQPDLVVYQTGGNELTYPTLLGGEGEKYEESYIKVLDKLRAGRPEASCLMIGPLDQATRQRGNVVSKVNLDRMITVQRRTAARAGCAFWDARASMGGEGAFARWLNHEPRYAWTDLIHLNSDGLELIGDSLADALLDSYDRWREVSPDAGWQPQDVEDEASAPEEAPPPPEETPAPVPESVLPL